ncbi:histidine kinase [Leptospira weilii serovar Topaz str. LT2116]|uniref:histidine kinase n=1 Tax=Leptospira weilii serovar Topaz str. LT2116 TaxID=1088540 RepID=M3FL77_9LEPT|nr:histidine kinase [Leptospira weilii serovar Topaz str. LT2116]
MFWNHLQRIYAAESNILKIRARYLFVFNLISVVGDSIALGVFLYRDVQFLPASFLIFYGASILSLILLWKGFFKLALTATLGAGIFTVSGGLILGNPHGNMLLAFPLGVILFLLFTNIRVTIYVSIYFFILMLFYFVLQYKNGTLVLSYAIDSILIYTLFTIAALLTVDLLNSYTEEKNELIKEIHHRVRNNLQVLSGLADLHRDHSENSQNILFEFQNRILAMSEVHNYMYKSDNYYNIEFSSVIDKIVKNLKNKHKNSNVEIINRSQGIFLTIETAVPCAMICNELLNNSIAHAFANSENPNIEISFLKKEDRFQLTLKDNGTGIPSDLNLKKPGTTGLTLIQILAKQIKGTFQLFNEKGAVAVLEFND